MRGKFDSSGLDLPLLSELRRPFHEDRWAWLLILPGDRRVYLEDSHPMRSKLAIFPRR